jgi:mannose-6-phosphate isomerase-like protein (cupin superfamily)
MSYPPIRYTSDTGSVSATLTRGDVAPNLTMRGAQGGPLVRYLATGATTNGDFGLYRWDFDTGPSGPSPHFHKTMSESFFILSGTVRLYDGAGWVDATEGDFLYVPPGGIHAFRNESGDKASMLLMFTPGAPREAYFEELAEIATTGRELTAEEWADLYLRHDQYMV